MAPLGGRWFKGEINLDRPLVSVLIPSYNHEKLISRAIHSVLGQDYYPIELVVVDDGSTDGSKSAIESVRYDGPNKYSYFFKENGGVSSALNFAFSKCSGRYIAVLASDDYFLPGKVKAQVEAFEALDHRIGIVHTSAFNDYGDGVLIDITGQYPPAVGFCFFELLSLSVVAVAPSVMFKREAYVDAGGFDAKLIAEDLDFYASVAAKGYSFHYIAKPLLVKTFTGRNLGLNVEVNYESHLATLEKHKGSLTESQYKYALKNVYLSKGRHAIGVNRYVVAFHAYRLASQLGGSGAMTEWCGRCARGILLSILPHRLRGALRLWRSSRVGRNIAAGSDR